MDAHSEPASAGGAAGHGDRCLVGLGAGKAVSPPGWRALGGTEPTRGCGSRLAKHSGADCELAVRCQAALGCEWSHPVGALHLDGLCQYSTVRTELLIRRSPAEPQHGNQTRNSNATKELTDALIRSRKAAATPKHRAPVRKAATTRKRRATHKTGGSERRTPSVIPMISYEDGIGVRANLKEPNRLSRTPT
jgi:hypothetical protein